jgi:hypothetical protein
LAGSIAFAGFYIVASAVVKKTILSGFTFNLEKGFLIRVSHRRWRTTTVGG